MNADVDLFTPVLPRERKATPYAAWKAAYVIWESDGQDVTAKFTGIFSEVPYEADAHFVCGQHCAGEDAAHDEISQWGWCGFYAMRRKVDVHDGAPFLLRVDLSGQVIVCEDGFRAEHQSVRWVEVQGGCTSCGGFPTGFSWPSLGRDRFVEPFVEPVCSNCTWGRKNLGTWDDLAAALGVEVRSVWGRKL